MCTSTGMTLHSAVTIRQQGHTITIDILSNSDKRGMMIKKVMKVSRVGQTTTITTTFDAKGATVVASTGEKATVPLATKTSRVDITDFWFVKVTPKVGQKAVYQSFDPLRGKWSDVKTVYAGKQNISVNGQSVAAHVIKQTRETQTSTLFLDAKGMPLKSEEPQLTMVRKG